MKSIQHKSRAIWHFSVQDWLVLVEAWVSLFNSFIALRRVSLEKLQNSILTISGSIHDTEFELEETKKIHHIILIASRLHILPMTCLPRALCLGRMLTKRGIGSTIQIGTKNGSEGLLAHAWLEINGEPIGENNAFITEYNKLSGGKPGVSEN